MVRNVCLAVVLLAGAGAAVAQDPPLRLPTAAWSAADCAAVGLTVEDPTGVECGFVTVPLRHGASDGPTIELAVAVLAATGERRDDPLFIAQGGPGGATIASFADLLLADPTLRPTTDRDLVLWDQRVSG